MRVFSWLWRGLLLGALVMLSACRSHSAKNDSASREHAGKAETNATAVAERPSQEEALRAATAQPGIPLEGEGWKSMFDGKALAGWKETPFAGHGEVEVQSGLLVLNMGDPFTGVNWTNEFPKINYELALDAMRVAGSDFFCGLTVPVEDNFCSLIVGGWGGSLLGISSLDHMDASENETTKFMNFEQQRWYRIRLRVTAGRLEGWVDHYQYYSRSKSFKPPNPSDAAQPGCAIRYHDNPHSCGYASSSLQGKRAGS